MLTHYVLWRDALEIVPCPRLNLRVATAALGRCNCSAEPRDLAGCQICIPSIAAHVTSGMLRKATQERISITAQIWRLNFAKLQELLQRPVLSSFEH